MAKAFFITFVLVVLGGFGFLFLNGLGFLPAPLYSFAYMAGRYVPFVTSPVPYLEKFEGNWTVTLTSDGTPSDLADCDAITGLVHAHNGAFSGNVGPAGARLPFAATTTQEGIFSGTFGGVTVHNGVLRAAITGKEGDGQWSDNYGCSGTARLVKQDPVVDPTQARVVSAKGDVELVRGSDSRPLAPGILLYEGDDIVAKDGTALLGVGKDYSEPVSIPAGTTYKVGR